MSYTQIKNQFMGKLRWGTRIFSRVGRDPFTDWALIFFSGLLLAAVLVAFGVYIYFRVDNGVLVTVPKKKSAGVLTLDRQALKDIISYAEQKKVNFEDIKKNPVGGVDPSI